jgi:hypothetical protein
MIEMEPLKERIHQLTSLYFGNTYDINRGTWGRKSVLSMVDLPIQYTAPRDQNNEFKQTKTPGSDIFRHKELLQSHYSSQLYSLHHIIQIATADPDRVELSGEMRNIISRLPPFLAGSEKQYMQFFADYGTHVVTRLALGGVLKVVLDSRDEVSKHKSSATGNGGVVNSTSRRLAHSRKVLVFRDGGGSIGPELSSFLEHNFVPDIQSSDWHQLRDRWIKELDKDPVFCPDHPLTEFQPMYAVRGLTGDEQMNLGAAYKIYVQKTVQREHGSTITEGGELRLLPRRKNWFNIGKNSDHRAPRTVPDSDWLQRDRNFGEAVKDLLEATTQALHRLRQGR